MAKKTVRTRVKSESRSRTRKTRTRKTRTRKTRTRKTRTRKTRTKRVKSKSRTRKARGGIIRVTHKKEEHVDPSIYRGGKSTKQSILFNRHTWNKTSANKWLSKHNIKPSKAPHLTTNFIRYRLENPNKFKRFATIKTNDDIDIVIGFK